MLLGCPNRVRIVARLSQPRFMGTRLGQPSNNVIDSFAKIAIGAALMFEKQTNFRCLDRNAEIEIKIGDLPHWFQPGAAIFVTFRTADSMPAEVLARWRRELEEWLQIRDLPVELARRATTQERLNSDAFSQLPVEQRRDFQRQRDRLWHRSLDDCHGTCLLKNADNAMIVARALRFYDGQKYDLDRFVIMPNHAHAIVQFRHPFSLDVISQSWLRYTARQINLKTNSAGEFWQGEPFDHVIRSPEQFQYLQRYIAENPTKARLIDGEFLYWQRIQE